MLSDVATGPAADRPGVRDHIQVVFVTTDPARDKPSQDPPLPRPVRPEFRRPDRVDWRTIKKVAGQVGVDIEGVKKLPSGGYDVGHSAQVIGFDRDVAAS